MVRGRFKEEVAQKSAGRHREGKKGGSREGIGDDQIPTLSHKYEFSFYKIKYILLL